MQKDQGEDEEFSCEVWVRVAEMRDITEEGSGCTGGEGVTGSVPFASLHVLPLPTDAGDS